MVGVPYTPTKPYHIHLIYIYEEDLASNNLQWFYAINPNQIKSCIFNIYFIKRIWH